VKIYEKHQETKRFFPSKRGLGFPAKSSLNELREIHEHTNPYTVADGLNPWYTVLYSKLVGGFLTILKNMSASMGRIIPSHI
jgi:hypothetical protein